MKNTFKTLLALGVVGVLHTQPVVADHHMPSGFGGLNCMAAK